MTIISKYIVLIIFLSVEFSAFSQLITEEEVKAGLKGMWKFEYENENLEEDTMSLVSQRLIEINKQKGKEIGYFKDGRTIKNKIRWKFIDSNKGVAIAFIGGFWVNEQEFIVKEISPNKITFLSCSKHDNCDEVYFIKE